MRLHPNLAEIYRRKVDALHQALADPVMRDEALGIVRGLVESVVLHPIDGGFEVEIAGGIAGMVALGASGGNNKAALKGAAALGPNRRLVKVVAGARNRRFLRLMECEIPRVAA